MYKKILIPIDLSAEEQVFKGNKTIDVARKLGDEDTKYILLNVVDEVPSYIEAELPAGILEKSKEQSTIMLKTIANNAGLNAAIEVRTGRPHTLILTAAEEDQADLIVMASHHPGLKDYLLGSTTARVVRHADCSVHVVR